MARRGPGSTSSSAASVGGSGSSLRSEAAEIGDWADAVGIQTQLAYTRTDAYYVDSERVVASAAQVRDLIRESSYGPLHRADQLCHAQRCGRALVGFREAPLAFPPTFKVLRQLAPGNAADGYIQPKEPRKMRVPAYCDRILHHSLPHLESALAIQRMHPVADVTTSDHKPICARLALTPSPPPPPRSLQPVTLTFRRLALVGEPGAAPLLPKEQTVKVRFFANPPGILVPPSAARASGGRPRNKVVANSVVQRFLQRGRSGSEGSVGASRTGNANLRTGRALLCDVTTDASGREVLTWDDADVSERARRLRMQNRLLCAHPRARNARARARMCEHCAPPPPLHLPTHARSHVFAARAPPLCGLPCALRDAEGRCPL